MKSFYKKYTGTWLNCSLLSMSHIFVFRKQPIQNNNFIKNNNFETTTQHCGNFATNAILLFKVAN